MTSASRAVGGRRAYMYASAYFAAWLGISGQWHRQWRGSFIVSLLLHVSGQVYPSTLAAASPSHWPTSNNTAMHTSAATLRGIAT
jgi:hypothetical protein